jgi:hypothetical protein
MTKKSLVLLALLVSIAVGISFLSTRKKSSMTTAKKDVDFSYQQVNNITRIFFANKSGKYIDLEKQTEGLWTLNQKHTAWQKKVDFLLFETFSKIRIKGAAPKPAVDNVIKHMAITGIKVELYSSDPNNPDQVYYVGGTTPDQLGTYFWIEGSETPYVTYIPGFTGYLNARFDLQERNWISRTIFEYEKNDIKTIEVNFKDDQYRIEQDQNSIKMVNAAGAEIAANPSALSSYLASFKKLNMEAIIDLVDNQTDSILKTKPLATISVTNTKGQVKTLNIYTKPPYDKMHNLHTVDGERLTYDPNRYYAKLDGRADWMIIQDYTFGKILRTASEFNIATD